MAVIVAMLSEIPGNGSEAMVLRNPIFNQQKYRLSYRKDNSVTQNHYFIIVIYGFRKKTLSMNNNI